MLYGVFTSLTIGGIILLLFLRVSKPKEEKPTLSQLDLLSKFFVALASLFKGGKWIYCLF
jgi:hypothetical protein